MRQLDAHEDISAAPERVWAVLTDFASFPQWNPFLVKMEGELRVGSRLTLTIKAPEMRPVTFHPRVLTVSPGREIRWRGVTGVRGLFDGVHSLTVEPLSDGRSRFRTHEDVSGMLLPFLGKVMSRSQQGFEQLARAVKERAEAA
jgi:hypothetical protein